MADDPRSRFGVRPFDYLIAGTQCKRCGLRQKHSGPRNCVEALTSIILQLKPPERHYKMVISGLREVVGFMESDARGAGEGSRAEIRRRADIGKPEAHLL